MEPDEALSWGWQADYWEKMNEIAEIQKKCWEVQKKHWTLELEMTKRKYEAGD